MLLCSNCWNGADGHIVNSKEKDKYNIKLPCCRKCFGKFAILTELYDFVELEE